MTSLLTLPDIFDGDCKLCIFFSPVEPDAPAAPTVNDVTKSSAVVTWQPPANDGGSPILGYHLEKKSGFSGRWTRVNKDLIPDTKLPMSDLIEDNTYEFRVIAENKAGPSKPSPPSESIKAKNPWGEFVICMGLYIAILILEPQLFYQDALLKRGILFKLIFLERRQKHYPPKCL